jgi:autotransporter-associated beta strand protein
MKRAGCAVAQQAETASRATASRALLRFAVVAIAAITGLAPATAMAQAKAHAAVKRGDDPLSRLMWSPPPPDALWIYNEAQWGLPSAPFVFSGDTLYIGGSFESSRPVLISSQARFHTAVDTTLHLSGVIDRQGSSIQGLVKKGPGTLALSGRNQYRGNTIVEQGTLHVIGDTALGQYSRNLELYGGAALSYGDGAAVFNTIQLREQAGTDSVTLRVDAGTAKQVGTVNAGVPIIKRGTGTLVMGGIVTLPSSAVIEQGSLFVDNDFSGSVQVNPGARLGGSGKLGSVMVLDGGVLAAGTGAIPSTMNIRRTLEFKPGAMLEVDVGSAGAADLVQVAGKALLAGRVHALAASGDWQPSTHYTVLRAEQGFDGTRFDSASTSLPFLQASLSYDVQEVHLRLDRNTTPLDEVAETPTEEAVADAVETIESPVLRDEVVQMDAGQARQAFNRLSGSWNASVLSGVLEDSRFVREAALRHGAGPAGLWHEAFYSSAERRALAGLPADARDSGGLVLGCNHALNPAWRASAFFAVQRSDSTQRLGAESAGIDSVHAGLGISGRWRGVDLAMGTAYAWHKIRSQRRIAIAGLRDVLTGRYGAESVQLFAEIAAPLRWLASQTRELAERARQGPPYSDGRSTAPYSEGAAAIPDLEGATAAPGINPYLRMAWVQASTGAWSERGGAAALRMRGERRGVLFTGVGLKASHALATGKGTAQVQGEVGWRHASGDVRGWSRQRFHDAGTTHAFTSEGHAVAKHAWVLRLAVQGDVARNVKLGVAYGGQYGRGVQDHGARLDVRWFF